MAERQPQVDGHAKQAQHGIGERDGYSLDGLPAAVEAVFAKREYEGRRREPDFELMAMTRHGPPRLDFDDPLVSTLFSKSDRAADYWLEVAEKSAQTHDWTGAWQAWYRHAFQWNVSDRDLLGVAVELLDVAEKGGFVGWHRLLEWRFG